MTATKGQRQLPYPFDDDFKNLTDSISVVTSAAFGDV